MNEAATRASRALAHAETSSDKWGGAAWSRVSRLYDRRLRSSLIFEELSYPYRALPSVGDPTIDAGFAPWKERPYRGWLYDLSGGAWIEPARGYVIGRSGMLVNASFPYWEEFTPSIRTLGRYLRDRRRSRRKDHFDVVVSMRLHDEGNYYHFWDDFFGRLRLLDELQLDYDTPFLIGPRLYEARFFQEALLKGNLQERRWVVHNRFVHADRAIFGHAGSLRLENFRFASRALGIEKSRSDPCRRIFLTRAARRGRHLSNQGEVLALLSSFGFEAIDSDALSLDDQIEVFAGARAVVAVHGAGVVNIQFRDGRPLTLVELFAPHFIRPPFAWLSHELGWEYQALRGYASDSSGGFSVDTEALRRLVLSALEPDS